MLWFVCTFLLLVLVWYISARGSEPPISHVAVRSLVSDPAFPTRVVGLSLPKRKRSHFDVMARRLHSEGVELEWFVGLDGHKLSLDDYDLEASYRRWFEVKAEEYRRDPTQPQTNVRGHLGATISHVTIWRSINEMTLVMEDDITPVPDFRARTTNLLRKLTLRDPAWDVLLLGWCCQYKHTEKCKCNDVEPVVDGTVRIHYFIGMFAYVVRSRHVAEKMLDLLTPLPWHVDVALAEACAQHEDFRVYGALPTLANHPGSLRISSFDYTQIGDWDLVKTDTNR